MDKYHADSYDEYYDYSYVRGQVFPGRIGFPDSYIFDLYDTGAYLLITLANPTPEEIKSISEGGEIRMTCFHGLAFFTFKFGKQSWADTPYNPHLSIQASDLRRTIFESCSHMTIILCNSVNGRVEFSGTVKFNEELSAAIRTAVMLLLSENFNAVEHDYLYTSIQEKYTPEQIAEAAVARCKYEKVTVPMAGRSVIKKYQI